MKATLSIALMLSATTAFSQVQPSAGTVVRHADFASRYVAPRHIDVWLPPGYDAAGKHTYRVLYMHDGQNLFDPRLAYGDQEWGVDETLTRLHQEGRTGEVIVVGIWNTPARFREYMPLGPFRLFPDSLRREYVQGADGEPLSDEYLKFMVEELKPFIDSTYHTRPERKHTFVMGSSMGGLISMYAALEYPEVFAGAGCLSTHWPVSLRENRPEMGRYFARYLEAKLPERKRAKLYFDYGTATLDAWYEPHQQVVDATLQRNGYTRRQWITRRFEGAEHNERAWRGRLHLPVVFLLGNKGKVNRTLPGLWRKE